MLVEENEKLARNMRNPDGTTTTISNEIRNKLQSFGLDIINLVGLGSYGASVMFGKKGGIGVLLSHVHCVAHRLAFACSDAAKDEPYL